MSVPYILKVIQIAYSVVLSFILSVIPFPNAPAIQMNLVYAEASERNVMDVYYPANVGDEANAILYIHGGSWTGGDKITYAPECLEMAKKGYVTATMSYRFAELPHEERAAEFDNMVEDIANAIKALDKKMRADGITPKKLVICGVSAGGHLTLLYGYKHAADSAIPIAFLAPDVAPIAYFNYFNLPNANPLTYVKADSPPTLARYSGPLDTLVPAADNEPLLADALTALGVPYDMFYYENSEHFPFSIGRWPGTDYKVHQEYLAMFAEYCVTYLP